MAMLGLDPRQQQEQQRAAITAQSQRWEDELTKQLRQRAFGEQQPFTSPWQVAGQMAQAISGRMHAGQNAQNYAALNAALAPGEGGETGGAPVPSAPQAPPTPDLGAQPNAPQARHGGTPFSPEVKQAIIEGSQAAGVDPNMMAVFAHIESDGKPDAHSGHSQYKGLMQLNEHEMAEMSNGQGNVWNPKDSVMAAGLIAKRNQAAFEKFSGRPASPFDTYMMHQQGPAGYMQHVAQPDAPAIQNMLGTAEGRAKGPAWAHAAIVENGGHPGDTSAQFIGRWRAKFDRMAGGDMGAFQGGGGGQGAPTQVASLTGAPGASGAPAPSPAGPQGTQVAQATGGAPGQFGMEQIPLTPEMQAGLPHRPPPQYNLQQLQQIRRMYGANAPIDMDKAWQELQQYNQPLEVKVPGGTLRVPPGGKVGTYVPDIQTKTIKAAGGNEIPYQFYMNSRGEEVGIGGGLGGNPEQQLRHVGSIGNDITAEGARKKLEAELPPQLQKKKAETDIDVAAAGPRAAAEAEAKVGPALKEAEGKAAIDLRNIGPKTTAEEQAKLPFVGPRTTAEEQAKVGPAIQKKEGEERVTGQQKLFNTIYAGLHGGGMNAAEQAPILKTMKALAPRVYSGSGADTMLELNRLADKVGLSEHAAAPRELFSQLANKIINDQFAGLRNLSGEEGAQAMKVFKSMLDIEEKSGINANTSLPGIMAQLSYAEQQGQKAVRFAKKAHEFVGKNGALGPQFLSDLIDEAGGTEYANPLEEPAKKPSAKAIELLKSKPELRERFDERYGKGAAERALGAH